MQAERKYLHRAAVFIIAGIEGELIVARKPDARTEWFAAIIYFRYRFIAVIQVAIA